MKLSTPGEAASRAATQEFPNIWWILKVHHCVHNRPPLVRIQRQINPLQPTSSYLSKIHFKSIHPPSGFFLSGFTTNMPYKFLLQFLLNTLPISSIFIWSL
jgi:hypothetical protein